MIGRRPPTRRYTYGFGRIKDLAGVSIVAMIAISAVVTGVESLRRLLEPQPVTNLGWVLAAGLIGFTGNELVAIYSDPRRPTDRVGGPSSLTGSTRAPTG